MLACFVISFFWRNKSKRTKITITRHSLNVVMHDNDSTLYSYLLNTKHYIFFEAEFINKNNWYALKICLNREKLTTATWLENKLIFFKRTLLDASYCIKLVFCLNSKKKKWCWVKKMISNQKNDSLTRDVIDT